MGQEPSTSGPAVTDGQDPERIREQIEDTRQELGNTVEALAAKTDIKAQARRKVDDAKASAAEKKDELFQRARNVSPDSATGAAAQITETARANPLPLAAAGAFLAGFLAGRITKA